MLYSSKKMSQREKTIDYSNSSLEHDLIPDWIRKHYEKWQSIKNIDYREKITFPAKIDWSNYYSIKAEKGFGGFSNYNTRRIIENFPFFNAILKETDNKKVIELGFGIGTGLIELFNQGVNVVGIDYDINMLMIFQRNVVELSSFKVPPVLVADFFTTPFRTKEFNISYSHGTLEHFEDSQIIKAIKEALRISQKYIFSVPTDLALNEGFRNDLKLGIFKSNRKKHDFRHFGNERYLDTDYWEGLIMKAGATIEKKSGYWIPGFKSKTRHPLFPENYYSSGIYACYTVW